MHDPFVLEASFKIYVRPITVLVRARVTVPPVVTRRDKNQKISPFSLGEVTVPTNLVPDLVVIT
jgi:hypothetical protein